MNDERRMGRTALLALLALNGVMFAVEVAIGWSAESMGLIADGLDMGADAAVYLLALLAVGASAAKKLRAAQFAGRVQLILAVGVMLEVARRFVFGSDPEPTFMIGVSLLALAVNVTCLALLRRHSEGEVHLRAAWIFSATDVQVNLGVLAAGLLVGWLGSPLPDLIIGLGVTCLELRGALRIRRSVLLAVAAAPTVPVPSKKE